jgi:hypothetical protein
MVNVDVQAKGSDTRGPAFPRPGLLKWLVRGYLPHLTLLHLLNSQHFVDLECYLSTYNLTITVQSAPVYLYIHNTELSSLLRSLTRCFRS